MDVKIEERKSMFILVLGCTIIGKILKPKASTDYHYKVVAWKNQPGYPHKKEMLGSMNTRSLPEAMEAFEDITKGIYTFQ